MARKPRVEFVGAIYHVICRGNNKEDIFKDEIDKKYFLKQLKGYKMSMGFSLLAYVLMSNHYHLLIQANSKPLRTIMHNLNNNYSKYYNGKYERTGHVFEGRYKGILVKDETYILTLIKYIHRNPVKGSLCEKTSDYKWSSDAYYRNNIGGLVDIDLILDIIAKDRSAAINYYCQYIDVPELEKDSAELEIASTIGESEVKQIKTVTALERLKLDYLLDSSIPSLEDLNLIKTGSKKRYLTPLKELFIKRAYEQKYALKEIAGVLNLSESAVHRILKLK